MRTRTFFEDNNILVAKRRDVQKRNGVLIYWVTLFKCLTLDKLIVTKFKW